MKIIPNLKKIRGGCEPLETREKRTSIQMFSLLPDDGKSLEVYQDTKGACVCLSDTNERDSYALTFFDTFDEAEQEAQNIISAFTDGQPVYWVK